MADIKWSAFSTTATSTTGDTLVGLHSGNNYQFGLSPAPSALGLSLWDSHSNFSANSFLSGYASTATAATTTTLTVSSAYQQFFTGSTTETVVLPMTSTLALGQSFYIVNNSTGVVTVESSGLNTVQAMAAGTSLLVTCILTSGTTAASWNIEYGSQGGGSVSAGLINQLAWYSATGDVVSGLTIVNSAGLTTTSGGVPTWVAYTGSGAPVLANTPALITPNIGAATGTSLTTTGALTASGGALISGASSGSQGTLLLWSPTTATGFFVVQPQANSGNYQNTLQNAVTTAARAWTLPDATGTIALTGSSASGYVLLAPSGNQTITNGALLITNGLAVGSAAGGSNNVLQSFSPTTLKGNLVLQAANNTGNTQVIITNAAFGQGSVLTLPDPGTGSATFGINTGSLTGGHLVSYNGTTGLLQDSGIGSTTTGAGAIVLANTPTLITPVLGAATATSINFGGSSLSTYTTGGTFTPVFNLSTAGDLSVTYTLQNGYYSVIGNIITVVVSMSFTPTYTTASGSAYISGLPFVVGTAPAFGSVSLSPVTFPAGTTYVVCQGVPSLSRIYFNANGSLVASAVLSQTSFVTGTGYSISATMTYLI